MFALSKGRRNPRAPERCLMSGRITVLVHKSHGPDHVKHVVVMYKVRLKGCPDPGGAVHGPRLWARLHAVKTPGRAKYPICAVNVLAKIANGAGAKRDVASI